MYASVHFNYVDPGKLHSFVYDVFKNISSSFSIIFVLGSKDYTTIHIYHPSISIDTDICYNHVACKDRCLGPKIFSKWIDSFVTFIFLSFISINKTNF